MFVFACNYILLLFTCEKALLLLLVWCYVHIMVCMEVHCTMSEKEFCKVEKMVYTENDRKIFSA